MLHNVILNITLSKSNFIGIELLPFKSEKVGAV